MNKLISLACALIAALLIAGCQTTAKPSRVKVVAIADTCPTNGFAMARVTNTDALERR